MKTKASLLTTCLLLPLALSCDAQSPAARPLSDLVWHQVAHDDAGNAGWDPHLVKGEDHLYDAKLIPAFEKDRTVATGNEVVFSYVQLAANAHYRVQLVFVTDDKPREERALFNGHVIRGRIVLSARTRSIETIDVPAGATNLEVRLERISGPNAILSEINVESTDPRTLPPVLDLKEVDRLVKARVRYTSIPDDAVSLNGQWSFCANGLGDPDWKPIDVPGEWVMQGFTVKTNLFAGYKRSFTAPAAWNGKRVFIRFDGVYSETTVWLNGKNIGEHLGGFTPFELDVTESLREGENTLALAVRNKSVADALASGSRYAEHPLGGILRKVQLFAVPEIHVAGLEVTGTPEGNLSRGTARVVFQIVNDSKEAVRNIGVMASVNPSGATTSNTVAVIAAGERTEVELLVPVEKPELWDNEHPNLSTLTLKLSTGDTLRQRFGFRRIEIRGNQLFVNGQPVKLRGVCLHQTHPTRGRALTPELNRQDVELYREANVNLIRTSHYSPPEELLEACDELGIFVECEAPLCWAACDHALFMGEPEHIVQVNMENVQFNRNHPAVLMWSLANESKWVPAFRMAAAMVKEMDPSRPRDFNDNHNGAPRPTEEGYCEIAVVHYPGPTGPDKYRNAPKPVYFGEYCHLNCYNRFELSADPGLCDVWGRGLRRMWDAMFQSQGVMGGSIWAAMDDTFFLPDGRAVGYGEWGLLDNWRRAKPEYWQMKKTYSPVRIDESQPRLPVKKTVELPVLNQANFSNLREFGIRWSIGRESGTLSADIAPHAKGTLQIRPKHGPAAGDIIKIEVRDPRGFLADEYAFTFGEVQSAPFTGSVAHTAINEQGGDLLLTTVKTKLALSRANGLFSSPLSGPVLMVLPLNGEGGTQLQGNYFYPPDNHTATGWKLSSLKVESESVTATGEYAEAKGSYTYALETDGVLRISYQFTVTHDVNPRQIGLVFDLPRTWDALSWQRNAPYTVYPEDQIGRPAGTARAFGTRAKYEPVDLRQEPNWPWSQDATEGGTRDFRTTREHILWCKLADGVGQSVKILSDGSQNTRVWVEGNKVRLLVADFSNMGAAPFFGSHASKENKSLKAGGKLKGVVRLLLN